MNAVQENPVANQVPEKNRNFIERHYPSLWTYIRLMRGNEYGIILAYWPFAWGLQLAANVSSLTLTHIILYLALFALSCYLWSGAAAVINDIWDVDFDRKVGRCKSRPLASGEISLPKATRFYIVLQLTSLVPTMFLNGLCQKVLLLSIIPCVIYPFSKRFIGCLSFTFGLVVSWGVFIGWTAVMDNLDPAVCGPLHFGSVCWTVFYDTIYGAQDKDDDAVAGVKSTYLTFGSNTKILLAFSAVGTVAGLSLAGTNAGLQWPYYVGLLVCSLHLVHQLFKINLDDPEDCVRNYNEHTIFGLVVFLAMLAGSWNVFQSSAVPVSARHEL